MDKNNWFHHFLQHKYMERQGLKKKMILFTHFQGYLLETTTSIQLMDNYKLCKYKNITDFRVIQNQYTFGNKLRF